MEKIYEIFLEKNVCVIFATTSASPLDYIGSLTEDIKNTGYKGEILFDLLLCNGTNNRYIKTYFDGNSFDFNCSKRIKDVDENIKRRIFEFLQNNLQLIDNNLILQNVQKFLLRKGIII